MLYKWQEEALNQDNDYALWCCEVGTGKSYAANLWLEQKDRLQNALIICPKQIRGEWQERRPDATVYSFEDFKKYELPENPSAVLVDEADAMASPLFVAKQRSRRAERLYNYLQHYRQAHVLLLTATPVRSTPWNMHTLLIFLQKATPHKWKNYRDIYFHLENKPYLPRPAWLPKPGWRIMMQELIEKNAITARMRDMVDHLPPETEEVIKLKAPDYEDNEEWEPMAQFVADHRLEQRTKSKAIKRAAKGYRKAVVVAHFREQIDELKTSLAKERAVYVVDGRTKDVHQIIKDAEADPECYLIVQAAVGAGFSLHTFSVMIFASQGYGVRNWVQMKGRIRRIDSLKPVKYIYLQGGRCDTMIYKSVMAGKDFVPSQYVRTTEETR